MTRGRSLRRSLRSGALFALALAVLAGAPSAGAATFSVVSGLDETNPNNGTCALREAIINANNNNETTYPECDFDGTFGADTITIATSISLQSALNGGDDLGALGDLDVTDDLTIQGTSNLTVQAGIGFTGRLFEVPSTGDDFTLNGFKLQLAQLNTLEADETVGQGGAIRYLGGSGDELTLSDMWVTQNSINVPTTQNLGGGVYVSGNDTNVTIQNGTVIDVNTAGVANTSGNESKGAGVAVQGINLDLSITGSEIKNNTAGGSAMNARGAGAGIYYGVVGTSPMLTLTSATIDGNIAGGGFDGANGDGGGIEVDTGSTATVNITDSSITTNQAAPGPGAGKGQGGGLLAGTTAATITLDDTLVDQNLAGGNDGTGSGAGGGISSRSDLTLTNGSVVSNNDAGITNQASGFGEGGGIHVEGAPGGDQDLIITDSSVTGNEAGTTMGTGGGIDMFSDGDLSITDSDIEMNEAAGASGGIQRSDHDNSGADPTDSILRSTIADNEAFSTVTAGTGGGMTLESSGTATIDSSTFSDNFTSGPTGVGMGGGLVATSALGSAAGGGSNDAGVFTIVNSTFSDNRASSGTGSGDGGGLVTVADGDHLAPAVSIAASTFADNEAGINSPGGRGGNLLLGGAVADSVDIRGTIITGGVGDSDENCGLATPGLIESLGGSVEGPNYLGGTPTNDCELDGPNDIRANPLLGPLQLNAPGTTATHALPAGSPALDRYSLGCPATDQRGVVRPQGTACDAGAYERVPTATATSRDSTAPSTTITENPKNKIKTRKKRVRVTWEFVSSEPGQGGFQCQIDVEQFVDCVSPFSVRVRPGSHTFRVRAYDAAGNPDSTLETDTFKVLKKKPKP